MSFAAASSFRRYGQRDDRRRRLLTDELANPDDWPACQAWPEEAPPPQKSEHYGDADFLERQCGCSIWSLAGWSVWCLCWRPGRRSSSGLEASYAWMLDRVADGGAPVAALDLAAKGSLGCWFSSLLLLAAAAVAILVYAVRRHRTDDYQGRYRIWLWAAGLLVPDGHRPGGQPPRGVPRR